MISKRNLEKFQVLFYICAITLGVLVAEYSGFLADTLDQTLWPSLGLLLFVTFTQTKLIDISDSFKDLRFLKASFIGNFAVLPLLIWILVELFITGPAVKLGVLLVLLVPCTDWFITFCLLGKANVAKATAITPLNLLFQLVATPIFLWIAFGKTFYEIFSLSKVFTIFLLLIFLPMVAAYFLERWARNNASGERAIDILSWFPVPLLSFVVFGISVGHAKSFLNFIPYMDVVFLVFAIFLVVALAVGYFIGKFFCFSAEDTRTLIFSFSTRNSFVVLPLAMTLDKQWESAITVIVFQSIVELVGMLIFIWLVPRIVTTR